MKRTTMMMVLAGALSLTACETGDDNGLVLPEATAKEMPAAPRSTSETEVKTNAVRPRLTGSFETRRSSSVATSVGGVVRKVWVEEGDHVEKGDRLFDIDAASYRLQVEQAAAAVKTADAQIATLQTEVDRAEALLARSAIARGEVERLRGQLNTAQAQRGQASVGLKMAKKARQDSLVKAPFAGVVTEVNVAEGEFASPGPSALVEIDEQSLILRITVPAEHVGMLTEGSKVEAHIPALKQDMALTVERINSRIAKSSRSFDVIAKPDTELETLRAGMFAEIALPEGGQQ